MTVEQTPLPVRPGQRPRDENLTLTFAKVREVTGAPDHIIEEAIRACRRTDGTIKVEDVVTTIITDDSVTAGKAKQNRTSQRIPSKSSDQIDAIPGGEQVASTSNPPGKKTATTSASASSTSKPAIAFNEEYIDLTRDPQGILGGQVSREEQDISRVLEASLAESKGNSKRKRGELWFVDPLNPYERKRQDAWPVGLKNVGNTCWFSAVIQSLFHIRKFRDIVLNFKPKSPITNESSPNLRFVSELRQLFALLVASKKKYVDPSRAVDILKENSSTTTVLDGQQDVSEFQHKLLDWLEDAFQVPAQEKGVEKPPLEKNPVNQLFQGKYKAEGFHQGTVFSQEVTFGQYPLNVIGFSDIHESLEATTAQGEIETVGGDPTQKSGQEIWFTHLPVVLTFELSRFGFNQQLNRPEKIHQHLSFPPVIYVDRYLECNKSVTRQKREEARKLKEELASLQDKLDKFMNYGSSSKRYPLPDVLQYALEFAQSSPAHRPHNPLSHPVVVPAAPVTQPFTAASSSQDVEMKSPVPSSRDCNKSTVVSSCDVSMTSIGETPPRVGEQILSSSAATAITTTTPLGATKPSSTPIPVTHLASAAGKAEKNTHLSTSPASLSSAAPEAKKFKDSSVQADYSSIILPSSCSSSSSTLPTSGGFQASSSSSLSSPSSSHLDQAGSHLSERVPSPMHLEPHPKTVTEDELRVLQDCLRRWRQEVEMDVRELQTNISALKGKLDRMYSEDNMKKFPYHLHAVLVHEGQAVSGHYWAFIQDPQSGKWLKFNDITASESSFEEMHKESVGGFHNASAYCLMYVDRSRLEEAHGRDQSNSATETDLLSTLPPDLQQVVEEDNHLFTMEMLSWDEEQKRKVMEKTACASAATVSVAGTSGQSSSASVSTMTSPPASSSSGQMQPEWIASSPRPRSHSDDQDVVVTGEQRPGETGIIQPLNSSMSNMAKQHAQLSLQATLTAVTQAISAAEGPVSPQEVMKRSLDRELQRLRSDKKQLPGYLPLKDPRLDHMVLYLLSAEADMNTIRLVLSEQFSMCVLLDSASRVKGVRQVAHEMYSQFYKQSTNESVQHYKFWHRRYHHFRQAMYMFTAGVEAYCAGRYHEALPYFNQAWLHNQEPGLSGLPKQMMKHGGIDPALLAQCRRNCLQKLNAATLQQFESPLEGDMTDALTTMSNLILPSLGQLAQSQFQEDTLAVEQLRSDWCQLLEKELTGDKIERLEDFLSKMFDGSGNQASESPKTVRDNDLMSPLSDQYRHAMELFKGTGELDAWLGGAS